MVEMGIWEESLCESAARARYARFVGVEFGMAPKECWGELRRELLEFEEQLASS